MPTILGGGLSGLAAGYYLTRRYVSPLTIYESSNRFGGWIRTDSHQDKGFLFEYGPRTIRPKGPAAPHTLELIDELGLQDKVHPIYPGHPAAQNRMIYAKNKLNMLPSSLGGIFKTIPPFTKPLISGLFHDLKARRSKQALDDESIYDFVSRRFGKEIADYAVSSMICGICAGDAKEISVRFLMNDLFEKEQKFGGVCKGLVLNRLTAEKNTENVDDKIDSKLVERAKTEKWSIYSIKDGIETLPKAIEGYLRLNGVDLQTSSGCSRLTFDDKSVFCRISGSEIETDHVISAIPSYKLANAVEEQHPSLACQLRTIPYVDVAVVNLQYSTPDLLEHDAFGFLVPPIEKLPILGVIFDSCCFDMRGNTVLTVMMGGKWFKDYFGENPDRKNILDIAKTNVKNILNIHSEPKLAKVNILKSCIPQYTIGHKARVEGIRNYIRKYRLPISLCGAAYDGVGVNDVIWSAKRQIKTIVGS